ncbi:hypothetical protein H1P_710007 [Hyella patelloides LEGE 07179]|uniref:NACHT conflict system C-terminal helical domain-containing protein n=1 Tax=Hyella patelloides LEGE 07179 TaxID=945734 RepID=A0A563W3V7_9CYAN|nr:hypothetical protein [Hyella patelloides]VEP18233.1 hypothetical protein H1P_710007 [Hyella patelloides LEGE 07179]
MSQIAYDTFIEDRLFFPKRTVVKQIEKLLPELLPDEKYVDGNHVLRDIEVQHGLLVERAESIYSFSHLTIQEFLTAQHIDYNDIPIEELVDNHLCDKRWREVFLLLAGLRKADNLLLAMEKKTHSLINNSKLQDLLDWVEKITDYPLENIRSLAKRAISFSNAINNLSAFIQIDKNQISFMNGMAYDYLIEFANSLAVIKFNSKTVYIYTNMNQTINIDNDSIDAQTINIVIKEAVKEFIDYVLSIAEYKIYSHIRYDELIDNLEKLKQDAIRDKQDKDRLLGISKKINELWMNTFNLTSEMMEISESEMETITDYTYTNLLMLQCKQAVVRVTPEVWKGIESRMLLPVKND